MGALSSLIAAVLVFVGVNELRRFSGSAERDSDRRMTGAPIQAHRLGAKQKWFLTLGVMYGIGAGLALLGSLMMAIAVWLGIYPWYLLMILLSGSFAIACVAARHLAAARHAGSPDM